MSNVAFIPVRGGSKSIPLKNIKMFCDKPLVFWTLKAACGCDHIGKVYVSTDNEEISNVICGFDEDDLDMSKVVVIGRSKETATDTASTESAMIEFAEKYVFDNIVLIQATSPLLQSADLNRGFEIFFEEGTDSVLSAVKQKRFNWNINSDGHAIPLNYDFYNRPRRQEMEGYYVENGAFYITSREDLLKTHNRLSGRVKLCEMSEETFFEIDEESDWIIAQELMRNRLIESKDE